MDPDLPSPNQESNETKAEFRKLPNEAAHRKYRRHSPMVGSSDEDGSPKRDHSSRGNPKYDERRKDDRVDDRRSSHTQHRRSSDSSRHSSRGNRHDESSRYGKHADEDDRSRVKSSSQSVRESRGGSYSDSRGRESDYSRPRDCYRDVDRYSRDRSSVPVRIHKEKDSSYDKRQGSRYDDSDRHARGRDHREENRDRRCSRDHRSDRPNSFEDSVGRPTKWETGGAKDSNGSRCDRGRSYKNDQLGRDEDGIDRAGGKAENRSASVSEDSAAKRPKLFSSEDTDTRKEETSGLKVMPEQTAVNGSDSATNVDVAKVAAMKAAELVNKNLTSSGIMTADQKKKLLWGNKKSTATDEPSNRWDSAMFSDHERQEKFNKLMSLRLPWYIWPIVGCEGRSEGELETPKWSRGGEAGAGFGEAIHCWTPPARWSNGWSRSVIPVWRCTILVAVTFNLKFVTLTLSLVLCIPLKQLRSTHMIGKLHSTAYKSRSFIWIWGTLSAAVSPPL